MGLIVNMFFFRIQRVEEFHLQSRLKMEVLSSARQTVLSFLLAKKKKMRLKEQPTKLVHEVAAIFHEPYIVRGYRLTGRSWWYYIISLFHWHNETMNTWSHLVAACYVFYQLLELIIYQNAVYNKQAWGLLALALGAIGCKLLSAAAHLLCSRSAMAHHVMYQIDYIGVSLNTHANGLFLFFMAGKETFYRDFGSFFLFVNTILGILVTICCTVSKLGFLRPFPPQRALWNVGPCVASALWHSIPLAYRLHDFYLKNEPPDTLLTLHYGIPVLFGLSSFFFASHIPERFFNGRFDIAMNSHTIFHIVLSTATVLQFHVGRQELNMRSPDLMMLAQPSFFCVFGWQILLVAFGIAVILMTHSYRIQNIDHTEKREKTN